MQNYSVLMSVYSKEKPEYLKESIESILNQTIPPNDFVIVCDGPLTSDLYKVLNLYESNPQNCINIIQLEQNKGLGNALNYGLQLCKNDIIARMDADDISAPTRCEKQLNMLKKGYRLVGSLIDEFNVNLNDARNIRYVPQEINSIKEFSKKRTPFNHPSVMFFKEDVIAVGGYIELYRLEDYYLWLRLIKQGVKMYNLQEVLVHMRVNQNSYYRRNSFKMIKSMNSLRKYQYENGFISLFEKYKLLFFQIILTCLPKKTMKIVYERILRNDI